MTRTRSTLSWSRLSLSRMSLAVVTAIVIGNLVQPVEAIQLIADINPALYGNLDQNHPDVVNGGCACGPTSVTNSLVYLQQEAPHLYGDGTGLVPYADDGMPPTQADMAAVANILGNSDHMDSAQGTYIEDFIYGKVKYIEDRFPGKTRYAAQVALDWREGPVPMGVTDWPTHAATHTQPSWVQDETAATLDFIYKQIRAREDVEVFVAFPGGGAHYLTVTGIEYDTVTNMGKLRFIDPSGGAAGESLITGLNMNGVIQLDYSGGASLFHAVSESPIPEPAAIALMLIGWIGLCAFRRRALRK